MGMTFIWKPSDITKDRQLSRAAAQRVERAIGKHYPGAEVLRHVPDFCTTWVKLDGREIELEWEKLKGVPDGT